MPPNTDKMYDHEQAIRWQVKSRLSYMRAQIDKITIEQTADILGRLLADINAYTHGLSGPQQ